MRILLLGSGLIGSVIARDLADSFHTVSVVDRNSDSLAALKTSPSVRTIEDNACDPHVLDSLLCDCDIAVNALPGSIGYPVFKQLVSKGIATVDISFFEGDVLSYDEEARKTGARVIVDAGLAPGLTNLFVGEAYAALGPLDRVDMYVGGLPKNPKNVWQYKAYFSPADVIEEYTRPARVKVENQIVERPALSEIEPIDFEGVGSFEAFLSDGLRTLLTTIPAKDMFEKTIRYAGHAAQMELLREGGFFSESPLQLADGSSCVPRRVTEALMFPDWKPEPSDRDLIVLRTRVTAEKRQHRIYELVDYFDEKTNTPGMARTTAYTATACVKLLAESHVNDSGVFALEHLGQNPRCVDAVRTHLQERGVTWTCSATA